MAGAPVHQFLITPFFLNQTGDGNSSIIRPVSSVMAAMRVGSLGGGTILLEGSPNGTDWMTISSNANLTAGVWNPFSDAILGAGASPVVAPYLRMNISGSITPSFSYWLIQDLR